MTKKNTLQVYVSEKEESILKAVAKESSLALSSFCRVILMEKANELNPEVASKA